MNAAQPILTPDEAPLYLLRAGLLKESDIVSKGVEVTCVSRLNHNLRVRMHRGPCWFLKQGTSFQGRSRIAREAAVYKLLGRLGSSRASLGLCRIVPHCQLFDPDSSLLVFASSPRLRSFLEDQSARRRPGCAAAAGIGRALASVHGTDAREFRDTVPGHPHFLPLGLRLHHPDISIFDFASQGCLEVIQAAQHSPELCDRLDALASEWRADTLIHGDARWENCLVDTRMRSKRRSRIWLVDWELAQIGDPLWDAGAHFGEYLRCWVQSAPLSGVTPPGRFLEYARFPLVKMWPAMRAFWQAYAGARKFDDSESEAALVRATRYAGAWLAQAAFESAQRSAQLTCHSTCLLQLAANVLGRPREAAVRVLGFSSGSSRFL